MLVYLFKEREFLYKGDYIVDISKYCVLKQNEIMILFSYDCLQIILGYNGNVVYVVWLVGIE